MELGSLRPTNFQHSGDLQTLAVSGRPGFSRRQDSGTSLYWLVGSLGSSLQRLDCRATHGGEEVSIEEVTNG